MTSRSWPPRRQESLERGGAHATLRHWNPVRAGMLIFVNTISLARLVLASVIVESTAHGHWQLPLVLLALGAISDQVDGWLARRLRVTSRFGFHVDSQSDRILLLSPVVGMMIAGDLWVVLGLILIVGVYLVDASPRLDILRIAWWALVFATICWGLVHHVSGTVGLVALASFASLGAVIAVAKRSDVARIQHRCLGMLKGHETVDD